jgi:hypothetical protein
MLDGFLGQRLLLVKEYLADFSEWYLDVIRFAFFKRLGDKLMD